jgi:hypothetical protein
MKYISIKIGLVIAALFGGVAGASDLPDCPSGEMVGRCFGTHHYMFGEYEYYVGEFKDDRFDGQGTLTWANGDKYVGEFKWGSLTGQGTKTYLDGTVKEGIWKDDEFFGTVAEFERAEKKRIAKEKQEELVRQEKKDKYDRIYNACLLDKSANVDMQVRDIYGAVIQTCISIAKNPSWFESMRYD